jgi:hypothetical protein
MKYLLLCVIGLNLFLSACSGNVSIGEVQVNGETVVEDYEASFGEEE